MQVNLLEVWNRKGKFVWPKKVISGHRKFPEAHLTAHMVAKSLYFRGYGIL